MHFVRRAAARAASSSPSTSFLSKSRSITTSPFALRSTQQTAIAQSISRRFYSEEKQQGIIGEAVESAKEFASETASQARGAFDSVADAASEYAPRGGFRNRPVSRVITPSSSIYIGNLLFDVSAADLEREFAQFGKVNRTVIATDDRGLSKGFGYVYYDTVESATAAIEAKHQSVFEGRRLIVNYQIANERRNQTNPPSKTLFIGNIPFEMSDADLNKLFRDIRNVIDVRVAIDRRSGQPRGFAHADFVDVDSAVAGKDALNNKELYGRKLRVDYSGGAPRRPRLENNAEAPAPPLEP